MGPSGKVGSNPVAPLDFGGAGNWLFEWPTVAFGRPSLERIAVGRGDTGAIGVTGLMGEGVSLVLPCKLAAEADGFGELGMPVVGCADGCGLGCNEVGLGV